MAAKPASTFRWANVGGDIGTPLSGKQDIGWVDDEEPANEYFNWLANGAYQWHAYLSDGALTGDHTITGELDVSGSVEAPDFYHGNRTIRVPLMFIDGYLGGDPAGPSAAIDGVAGTGDNYYTKGNGAFAGGNELVLELPVADGDRIKSMSLRVFDNDAGGNIQVALYKQSLAGGAAPGAPTIIGSTQTSVDIATNVQVLTITAAGSGETVVTNVVYRLVISIGTTNIRFRAAFLTYDRPRP